MSQCLASSLPHSLLFDMTTVSGRAQDQTTLYLLRPLAQVSCEMPPYGHSDGFLGLSQVSWDVFEEWVLDVPPQEEI